MLLYELFQFKICLKIYREFVEMDLSKKRVNDFFKDYFEYVKNMFKNGVWGDNVMLQVVVDMVNFFIIIFLF